MTRPLSTIARETFDDWKNISPYALPYAKALRELQSISDKYYSADARSIVLYFLSKAGSWRGDTARRITAVAVHKQDAFAEEVINTELDKVLDRGKDIDNALGDAARLLALRAHR